MARVRSFDVFDTLLMRLVGSPSGIFLAVGRRVCDTSLVAGGAEAFARSRALAERSASAASTSRQAPLGAIYEHLGRMLDIDVATAQELMAIELEVERELIVAVPGAAQRLDALRGAGGRLAFVSDMYLPTDFVTQLLDEHGMRAPGEPVFVSAELQMTKRHGTLFEHVLRELDVEPSDVVHVGDHSHSDVAVPRRLGLGAEHVTETALNRYELALDGHRWASGGLTGAFAGCSRAARLAVPAPTDHLRNVRDVSAGVVAPLLVGYVLWILHHAKRSGIGRILFVSRDGEVLLHIARRLCETVGYEGELDYVYGSRQAWYPAGAEPDDPEAAVWGLQHATDEGLHVLLDRCGVDAGEWPGAQVQGAGKDAALRRLLEDPAFHRAVTDGLRERQRRLERYLRDIGLLEEASIGVVDLGWHGRSLDSLSRFLARVGGARPTGYYMGLEGDGTLHQPTEVWLRGFEHRLRFLMMEAFCVGSHGQVVDFEADAPRPVLRSPDNRPAEEWGLATLRSTIDEFVDRLVGVIGHFDASVNVRHAVLDSFDLFYLTPTRAEALAWGSFPFEVGPSARSVEQLAPVRGIRRRITDRLAGGVQLRWPAGDEALAPLTWRLPQATWRRIKHLRSGRT